MLARLRNGFVETGLVVPKPHSAGNLAPRPTSFQGRETLGKEEEII